MSKVEKLAALFAKCVEINGLEAHYHSDSNKPNVFMDYQGHVSNWDREIMFYIRDMDSQCFEKDSNGRTWYEYTMSKLNKLQNHVSEVALDADKDNLDSIKKLSSGEMFLLKTPIDTCVRGEVCLVDGKRRYRIPKFKPNMTDFTFRAIKSHMEYLLQLKRGA